MKGDIVKYVTRCLEYQKIKTEKIKPIKNIYLVEIPSQKWKSISMDIIVGLPKIRYHHDCIFLVVYKLTKVAHFISGNTTNDAIVIDQNFLRDFLIA